MNTELINQLVQVRDNFKLLAEDIAWECQPKTERKFKKQLKALTAILKQLKESPNEISEAKNP